MQEMLQVVLQIEEQVVVGVDLLLEEQEDQEDAYCVTMDHNVVLEEQLHHLVDIQYTRSILQELLQHKSWLH
jgi:hypothetical protein